MLSGIAILKKYFDNINDYYILKLKLKGIAKI